MLSPSRSLVSPFVLVQRHLYVSEALSSKSILESVGIECVLSDEHMIRMNWFWSNALGGVKVWARESDIDDVFDVLDQEMPQKFEVEGFGEYIHPRCPFCGAAEWSFSELRRRFSLPSRIALLAITLFFALGAERYHLFYFAFYIVLVFVWLPLLSRHYGWHCNKCGVTWPGEPEE
jgi:hypothetical protein